MYEYSAQFTLTGSDGTVIEFNDGLSGLVLEEITGFDSPSVRTNIEDDPESDSAIAGDSFFGQRPVTMKGKIASLSPTARNAAEVTLQSALRGLRSDLTLKSTPSGLPAMQVAGRIAGLRITGGYVKDFLISLICADPRIYSQALHASNGTQAGTAAAPGAAFPWVFPVAWGGGSGAYSVTLDVANAGNFGTPPILRAAGPITSPQFVNTLTGESIFVDGVTLLAGEWLDVDVGERTVTRSSGATLYANVRFPGTVWYSLDPGTTTVQLWGTGTSVDTGLTVTWRDAWL